MKRYFPVLLVAIAAAGGCTTSKSSTPLSPSVAGPIAGVDISAPKVLEPAPGWQLDSTKQPITLLLENASTSGVRPLTYSFQVASDAGFTNMVFSRDSIPQGDNGRTSLKLPDPLTAGRTYYWRGRAQDGANTGPFSSAANFNLLVPIVINAPVPLSPVGNGTVSNLHPAFTFSNAPTSGPVGAITYNLEIATDAGFANKVAIWNVGQQANQTTLNAPADLSYSKTYFWHVRAFDPTVTGPFSSVVSFVTPAPPPPPAATPTPTPGPSLPPGTPCGPPWSTQLAVVQCRRAQYPGHMDDATVVAFLKGVAKDLNAAGFSGGPFGILVKTSGHQCNGYSCDIICNPNSLGYDVLSDSDNTQVPSWGSPVGVPNACQIQ